MRKQITISTLILLLVTAFPISFANSAQSNTEEPQEVSFCQLFKEGNSYLGKLVRIKVIWRYGHAFSYIYNPECKERRSVWITFDKEANLCERTLEKLNAINKEFYDETELIVVGRLFNCQGGCGHSSA